MPGWTLSYFISVPSNDYFFPLTVLIDEQNEVKGKRRLVQGLCDQGTAGLEFFPVPPSASLFFRSCLKMGLE